MLSQVSYLAKFNEDLNSLLICDVKFAMNQQPQLQQSTYFVIAFLNIICELSFSTQFKFSEFTLNVNFIWCLQVRISSKGSLTVWALYAYFSDSQNAAFELLVWCM